MLLSLAQRRSEDWNTSLRVDMRKLVIQFTTSVFQGQQQVQKVRHKPRTAGWLADWPAY